LGKKVGLSPRSHGIEPAAEMPCETGLAVLIALADASIAKFPERPSYLSGSRPDKGLA
jgi:hypothetical protein